MAENFGPSRVHWLLLGPFLSLEWPAESISCSPLPADQWGLSLEFVARGVGLALVVKIWTLHILWVQTAVLVYMGALSSSWPHHKVAYLRQGVWVSTCSRADLSQ